MAPDSHLQNQGIGSLANQWLSFHTEKKESFRLR